MPNMSSDVVAALDAEDEDVIKVLQERRARRASEPPAVTEQASAMLPVWEQFMEALRPAIMATGATVVERKGWMVLEGKSGNRIAIQKAAKQLPRVETTLDLAADVDAVIEKITNGRMVTVLTPRPEVVIAALEMLADTTHKIRARRSGGRDVDFPQLDDLL